MSARQMQPGETDGRGDESISEALMSLERALRILDDCDAPPHIGARLQEIISLVGDSGAPIAAGKGEA